jgi:cellulase/cellobiase CelA1
MFFCSEWTDSNTRYPFIKLSSSCHTTASTSIGKVELRKYKGYVAFSGVPNDLQPKPFLSSGARIRSGLLLDFSWDQGKITAVSVTPSRGSSAVWTSSGSRGRQVILVNGQTRQIIQSFWTGDIDSQIAIPVSLAPCDGLQGECVFS